MAAKMSTSSAMNPGLIFCLMICPLSLGGSITLFRFGMPIPASALLAICCWPIGIVGWQLIRFTIKEPDRLQRDEHLQRMFELKSTVGIKDHGQIKEVTVSSQLATNPALENRSEEAQAGE
ncbi:hypothetical protein [Sphingobium sp. Ant17]|uniref:hypothetical protein n=1 Tax=Sphingobium sp. Ant17 TaxID=1461752 RepID=UPI0004AFA181|nr:hypothetical protein [Sphingobium sp. Ant17]